MGYTHYYYLPEKLDHEKFGHLVQDIKKIVEHTQKRLHIPLGNGMGEKKPIVNEDEILFNGRDEDGHESFYITRDNSTKEFKQTDKEGRVFFFCKTARKPYDIAVTASLIALKHHFGDEVDLNTDGYEDDWTAGRGVCNELFEYGYDTNLHLN